MATQESVAFNTGLTFTIGDTGSSFNWDYTGLTDASNHPDNGSETSFSLLFNAGVAGSATGSFSYSTNTYAPVPPIGDWEVPPGADVNLSEGTVEVELVARVTVSGTGGPAVNTDVERYNRAGDGGTNNTITDILDGTANFQIPNSAGFAADTQFQLILAVRAVNYHKDNCTTNDNAAPNEADEDFDYTATGTPTTYELRWVSSSFTYGSLTGSFSPTTASAGPASKTATSATLVAGADPHLLAGAADQVDYTLTSGTLGHEWSGVTITPAVQP